MDFVKSSMLIMVILLTGNCLDVCNSYTSYQQCISSAQIQCMWNLERNNCHYTNDYLQGCSAFLNLMACQKQLGDPLGQIANCRFITSCEKIPDGSTEKCYNNLSKYGCLSVKNPQQICIWKSYQCYFFEMKQLSFIQENFDKTMFSVSACSLIEHYFVIHSSILWNLISYTPDIKLEAYQQQQTDLNVELNNTRNYDDANIVKMENNYLRKNGNFVWYKLGVSNEYSLTNLQISSRFREGCIALEIQNDKDILQILSLSNEIIGVNHIYCKYLNQIPNRTEKYVFINNKCILFDTKNLKNKNLVKQYQLNCSSLDQNQCIFFNSDEFKCQINSEGEYPCIQETIGFETDCIDVFCTMNQCQKLENHYIELSTNMCVDICTTISDRIECLQNNCIYLGIKNSQTQINCAPKNVCNQISLTKQNCIQLRAKCDWNSDENSCFELQDNQISSMKCQDTQNEYVCTLISLSDQMCYWSYEQVKCINILDQPLLIDHKIFIDRNYNEEDEEQISLICNLNLCKYNTQVATEYDVDIRRCLFDQSKFKNDLNLINKYHCLQNLKGFYQWNQEKQICLKIEQSLIVNKNCNELININERFCQYGLSSQSDQFVCVYDQISYSCVEKTRIEVNNFGCVGHGLSKELCLNKNVEGQLCNYSDGLCIELSINMINNLKCDSLININYQVCKMQQIKSILCKYDELTHSCKNINLSDDIEYNYDLNKYVCQAVTNSYTYFNEQINKCIQLNESDTIYFKNLKCEENFVNKQTCLKIVTEGQVCIWNNSLQVCKNYVDNFLSCSTFKEGNSKTCSSLTYKDKVELTTDYFCVYENNKCEQKQEYQATCGENQIMNIHYCSWKTGIDQTGQFVQMCAFVDYKCITLVDTTMDTEVIINSINCQQANSKSCYKVKTPGQYCYNTSALSKNKSIDYGCKNWSENEVYCYYLSYYFTDVKTFNANLCSSAYDECVYDSKSGCKTPSSTLTYDCEVIGLSLLICNKQTKDRRCAFINQICQFLPEYQIFTEDCTLLNQFACNSSAFIQCIWDSTDKICYPLDMSTIKTISSNYFCSSDESDQFIISGSTSCIVKEYADYNQYTCDTAGLNKYGCHSLPTQYCQYLNNQCQFYKQVLCEDYMFECSENNSNDQYCVFKDNQCFSIANTLQNCDSFEQTNYLFCYQYPNCIYKDKQCQQIIEYQKYQNCQDIDDITICTVQNSYFQCQYLEYFCDDLDISLETCPSLQGNYSRNACNYFQDCQYGYTKSGYGFCFQGESIADLTCDLLTYDLCLEDLSHLNKNLKCYWDEICKDIVIEKIIKCNDLMQYESSYAACIHFNNIDCKYSFLDKKCKLVNEYTDATCSGTSKLQCDQKLKTCYFVNNVCTTSGTLAQINKYGCIHKTSYYQYRLGVCTLLKITTYLQSCQNLSKDACLSKITKEIHCRWINEKCQQVLKQENKMITSCNNLNQRVCQKIALSNIQCAWNSTTSVCTTLTITSLDCTLKNQSLTTSISLCSSQSKGNCIRRVDGTQCNTISTKINSCTLYGLNQNACLTLTKIPCIWKILNNGGYCDDANLYQTQCKDLINEYACLNIKNIHQYCKWNETLKLCQFQEITDCISASYLNQEIPCKAVQNLPCKYNQLFNQCELIQNTPNECSEFYNQFACNQSIKGCFWNLNSCHQQTISDCKLFLNKYVCLNNIELPCQWINNLCKPFELIQPQVYCINLPQKVNKYVCQQNAIDPCNLDYNLEICIPSQLNSSNFDDYVSVSQLLLIQQMDYPQPLLQNHCINLQTQQDCIKSRMPNQACVWSNSCQIATNFNIYKCSDSLNIFACINVTTNNQLCYWNQKCLNWSTDNPIMSNVNINVCIHHSESSIYSNNSCQIQDLYMIKCNSIGISKQTCLSIPNKLCQWDTQLYKCREFVQDNLQTQCSDFQLVTPQVCQTQSKYACIYDHNTFSCIQAIKNSSLVNLSKWACLQIDYKPIYWNEFNQCEELKTPINCNSQLKVNSITCQSISDIACLYNYQLNQCVSQFNIWSLKCNSIGLNLKGCSQVQYEPCIFINNKCQKFIDYQSNCSTIKNVNALVCASLINSNCIYDSVNLQCYVPFYQSDICNIPGKNKNYCETNELCKWSQENQNCQCLEFQQEICRIENNNDCKSNPNCYLNGNNCIKKQCNHLTAEECTTNLDGKTCYLNIYNECQSATKCEDILKSQQPCSQFTFNSNECIQVGNTCVQQNNLELYCLYSDCSNPNCIYHLGICKALTCSDYNIQNCNQQNECYLDSNNICQILTSCSLINNYGEQAMNICNQVTYQGIRCNWQKISLLDETRVCTNQPCLLYGSSQNLCHGNEINGYSCILSKSLTCQQCEYITEKCQCNNQKQICSFQNGKCISILCASFHTQKQCEEVSNRCYWSTQIKQDNSTVQLCVKECIKIIDADECNARIKECYYEPLLMKCQKGQKQVITLSNEIIIQEFYSKVINFGIIILILFL